MSNFDNMNNKQLIEAFAVVIESVNHLRCGFDWVNDEEFKWKLEEMSAFQRRKLGEKYLTAGNTTVDRLREFFIQNIEDRIDMWKDMFVLLSKKQKAEFLDENKNYYEQTLPYIEREDFDWSAFSCSLEDNNETMQLKMIKQVWSELGVQVYGCRTNDNGRMCQCLRMATDTTAYKCFKEYLQHNNKYPSAKIPADMLRESAF